MFFWTTQEGMAGREMAIVGLVPDLRFAFRTTSVSNAPDALSRTTRAPCSGKIQGRRNVIQAIETSSSEARRPEAQTAVGRVLGIGSTMSLSSAISMISIAAARSAANETKMCKLSAVRDQLFNYAELQPRFAKCRSTVLQLDGAAYLRQLCRAISRSETRRQGH